MRFSLGTGETVFGKRQHQRIAIALRQSSRTAGAANRVLDRDELRNRLPQLHPDLAQDVAHRPEENRAIGVEGIVEEICGNVGLDFFHRLHCPPLSVSWIHPQINFRRLLQQQRDGFDPHGARLSRRIKIRQPARPNCLRVLVDDQRVHRERVAPDVSLFRLPGIDQVVEFPEGPLGFIRTGIFSGRDRPDFDQGIADDVVDRVGEWRWRIDWRGDGHGLTSLKWDRDRKFGQSEKRIGLSNSTKVGTFSANSRRLHRAPPALQPTSLLRASAPYLPWRQCRRG